MRLEYLVQAADEGLRAVDVLMSRTGMSRSMGKKIRLYGSLTRNGLPQRMVDPVRTGDFLVASDRPDSEIQANLHVPSDIPVRYRDDWLIVVEKPSGLVTHPSYLHQARSLTSLMADEPLHPVTRLDRDTSGAVLIALNGHAHYVLSCHPLRKIYLAAVHGRLPGPAGLVHAPIRRSRQSIMLREIGAEGLAAKTIWQELHYFTHSDVSLVRFELLTGRTHQIRVHSRALGCPLLGDGLYGSGDKHRNSWDRLIGRQALHAASIRFRHPVSGDDLQVTARLPADFRNLIEELFQKERSPV